MLRRRKRSPKRSRVLDGEAGAQLIAIGCSAPPECRSRWTLHLLADEMQRRPVVETVSHETVRQMLKKCRQTLATADVVYSAETRRGLVRAMEQVLDVYTRPHDPAHPVACRDETAKQCVKETRVAQPLAPGRAARQRST